MLNIIKRKNFLIPLILLIATLGFFIFRSKASDGQTLKVAYVKIADIASLVSSSGTLTGKKTANLKFKFSGKLSFIDVKAGDSVKEGQKIASLDTQDLDIALQEAQNTLRDKQAAAEKALDDVKNHDKDETLTQRQTRTTAEVARDNAYESVKSAQRAFQDAIILAPISGLVTQAITVDGQTVSATDLIAQIVDTTSVYFDTDVDEADIGKTLVGQPAKVTLDAYPDKTFLGKVDQILPQTKTTSSGATVITVRIQLDSPDITFVNGISGQASIIVSEAKNVLTVPLEAVREDDTVIIQSNNNLSPKKVTLGIKSDTDVEIKGLNDGDKVLLNPPSTITRQNQGFFGGALRFLGGRGGR